MSEQERGENRKRVFQEPPIGYYSNMRSRINLQCIGSVIRDGSIARVNYRSYSEREENAKEKLEKYIVGHFGEENAVKLMEEINAYENVMDAISFSLGMKAGATLQVKLLDNFETDI